MKIVSLLLCVFLQGTAFSDERQVSFDNSESEAPRWKWLPVTLTDTESELLSTRSDTPTTALDYYLLLPGKYFKNIADDVERRITFIESGTLSDQYLHAEYTIPATDAGAFSITIRLFKGSEEPLIAISNQKSAKRLFVAKENGPLGLWSISMTRPELWHYRGGTFAEGGSFVRVRDSIMPELSVDSILERYRNHYKAHLNHPTQKKSIWLHYVLPQEGNLVQVTGRENFMSPSEKYVWGEFTFNGDRFVPLASSGG